MAKPKKKQKQKPVEVNAPTPKLESKGGVLNERLPHLVVFLLGFFLYANTISFEYALDDKLYITHNDFTKEGLDGIKDLVTTDLLVGFYGRDKNLLEGGRYRPLPLITYAIEYELWEDNKPGVSHFISALLYGAICLLLYVILLQLFRNRDNDKWWWSIPFVAAVLYATHPIHTEIAATIKGRVEMMAVFFGLLSLYHTIRYYDTAKVKYLVFAILGILASFFSKEDGINFLGVIPLTLIFFREFSINKLAVALAPMIVGAGIYFFVRSMFINTSSADVPPELMNAPFMHAQGGERLATIMFTWGLYIKLMFLPHPLTHDYYPWHPLLKGEGATLDGGYPYFNWGDMEVIISAAAVIGLTAWALIGLRKKSVYSYGILLFFGTFILYSNLVFDIGTFMNERFMFIPSIGFCIIIAYVLVKESGRWIKDVKLVQGLLVVVLLAFSVKTISRNYAWENDFSLTTTDVKVSVNSAKCNLVGGGALVDAADKERNPSKKREMLLQGIKYLRHSIELYPTYIEPMLVLGNAHFKLGEFNNAIVYYENCLKINRDYVFVHNNLYLTADTLTKVGRIDDAIQAYQVLERYKPSGRVYAKLGEAFGRYKQDMTTAEKYLEKAIELEPKNEEHWLKLGTVFAMRGEVGRAMGAFNSALEINPKNAGVLKNIGILYMQMGQQEKGQEFIDRAIAIDPNQAKR